MVVAQVVPLSATTTELSPVLPVLVRVTTKVAVPPEATIWPGLVLVPAGLLLIESPGVTTGTVTLSDDDTVLPPACPVAVAVLVVSLTSTFGPQVYTHDSPGSRAPFPLSPVGPVMGEHFESVTTTDVSGVSPGLVTVKV